jgi:hypothetical protein
MKRIPRTMRQLLKLCISMMSNNYHLGAIERIKKEANMSKGGEGRKKLELLLVYIDVCYLVINMNMDSELDYKIYEDLVVPFSS